MWPCEEKKNHSIHTHAHTHTHTHTFSQGLKLKWPNFPRLDAEKKKKMRTELKITTMKEQIQKVKMVDIKSVIQHFRAFFVHISRQQIKPRQPHVLFITMEVGTHSKKLKQILELDLSSVQPPPSSCCGRQRQTSQCLWNQSHSTHISSTEEFKDSQSISPGVSFRKKENEFTWTESLESRPHCRKAES